jgi:D-sedoheptulose 7-phosphate isomerase
MMNEVNTELSESALLHVQKHAQEHMRVVSESMSQLARPIAQAAEVLTQALLAGGKVLACGNGGSATDASHFAAEMIGRLERERPGLPALALTGDAAVMTAIGNDYAFDVVFAKQVHALGAAGDVLLAISTSGDSANILEAVRAAHEREMRVIVLSGKGGGSVRSMLRPGDVEVCVSSARTMRIQEVHILVIHVMCDWVDTRLLGGLDE